MRTLSRKEVREAVKAFRQDYGILTCPVDSYQALRIVRESGNPTLIDQVVDLKDKGSYPGAVFRAPGTMTFQIIRTEPPDHWKEHSRERRGNFTLAHELGHIFLDHLLGDPYLTDEAQARRNEIEADWFAAELLMPASAFVHFRTLPEAAAGLWVSNSACLRRVQELGIQMGPRTCPRCGYGGMPSGARFCRVCGMKVAPGPNPEKEPDTPYLPPLPPVCPLCESDGWNVIDGECPDCGYSRRNECVPEYNQPRHTAPAGADYCERCGAETQYKSLRRLFRTAVPCGG